MKLTDEQRERMWQPNTLSMLRYNLENGTQTISNDEVVTLIDDIQQLRSSEQAWKEDANRWEQREWTQANEVAKLQHQLNQAIEVLEWIAECGTDYQSIRRARGFISSLQEDKT